VLCSTGDDKFNQEEEEYDEEDEEYEEDEDDEYTGNWLWKIISLIAVAWEWFITIKVQYLETFWSVTKVATLVPSLTKECSCCWTDSSFSLNESYLWDCAVIDVRNYGLMFSEYSNEGNGWMKHEANCCRQLLKS
jgi:hypothetical protein